jgi:hypothetical protein
MNAGLSESDLGSVGKINVMSDTKMYTVTQYVHRSVLCSWNVIPSSALYCFQPRRIVAKPGPYAPLEAILDQSMGGVTLGQLINRVGDGPDLDGGE